MQAMTEADPGIALPMERAGALDQLGIPTPPGASSSRPASSPTGSPSPPRPRPLTRLEVRGVLHPRRAPGAVPPPAGHPAPRKSLQQKPYVKDNVVFRRFAEIGQQFGRAFTPSCAWTDFRQQLIDFNKEIAEKQVTPKQALPELEKQMVQSLSLCVK